jgi:hypothetical protein
MMGKEEEALQWEDGKQIQMWPWPLLLDGGVTFERRPMPHDLSCALHNNTPNVEPTKFKTLEQKLICCQ